ncbi:hypothetical protein TBLA_0J01060 [Henningerozyma blattae CBS 6284]|uniref:glucan endo-1,3-beta-D-glucosidase n=1 Tax=Henningerozyma blattae (strain ATCC 34711 / CBS 6284 / DSM 70876 / NBRC 10599 / NRRL Y-10934 / UCD 77-7) TaxID=1071380 RepID=I2H9Q2_HENB6|nr:hypothetical protein TBLA_0J01060 [Tetrapisispora blattae CBS 6284]CCH63104.1 hypothetical protein TBLA_0J01060 [Tetrapisispora blattae CBS 6284]
MKSILAPIFAAIPLLTNINAQAFDRLQFDNVGFEGSYYPVKKIENEDDKTTCFCEQEEEYFFKGPNSPLSEYLSVHFRGPISIKQFGFYTSERFVIGDTSDNNSSDWTRDSYYNDAQQTADNVTFLNLQGDISPCLGPALTLANSDGIKTAFDPTVLENNNYLSSGNEIIIYSGAKCSKSQRKKGCGIYRKGIPAYYGFNGNTKMFLFEFSMPTDAQGSNDTIRNFNMPGIWLLNDHIARTAEYPTDNRCSCFASGCGGYDIFKVTDPDNTDRLYSNVRTLQNNGNATIGMQSSGYIQRATNGTMKGGVVFDSEGNIVSFISSQANFDDIVKSSDVNSWLSAIVSNESTTTTLMSVSSTSRKWSWKNEGKVLIPSGNSIISYFFAFAVATFQLIL